MKNNIFRNETATMVIAHLKNYKYGVDEWKDAFYELWRYQMTYGMAYSIEVHESSANGVFVRMVIKDTFKKNILNTMYELGYQDIDTYKANIGIVDGNEIDDMIDDVYIDY